MMTLSELSSRIENISVMNDDKFWSAKRTIVELNNLLNDTLMFLGENVFTYNELPKIAKLAIDVYPYLDKEYYNNVSFKMYYLPMNEAVEKCIAYDELKEVYSSFEEYHKEYISCGDVPDYTIQYPVFHEPDNKYEWLSDGWHRFHSYYKNGFKYVPVIEIL